MMESSKKIRFIIIDDDKINNQICRLLVKLVNPQIDVCTFEIAEQGFEFICREYDTLKEDLSTILFLDINMPIWSGWDFLENFEKLDKQLKDQIKIFILSSSVDPMDIERAKQDLNVVDFVIKPLTEDTILSLSSVTAI